MTAFLRASVVVLFLLVAGSATAEVKIAPWDRVKNRPPGRCGWCILETLGRHHRIKPLYGLAEDNPSRADVEDLEDVLLEANIPYHIQYPGSRETKILHLAIQKNLGAAVGFRELFPGAGGHIVALVDFQPQFVKILDSSDEDYRVRTMTMERFLSWWDGFALVVEKKKTHQKTAGKK